MNILFLYLEPVVIFCEKFTKIIFLRILTCYIFYFWFE